MGIRRRTRPRHAKDDSEDMVIDLRERLAPYGRREGQNDDQADAAIDDDELTSPLTQLARRLRSR